MIQAGGLRSERARSAVVTITAQPPSLSMQQSSRCSGSAIMRDAWWSATVIGLRIIARGFIDPCVRSATATAPNCSLVQPYSIMWRRANMPNACAGVSSPQGICICSKPPTFSLIQVDPWP